MYRNCLFLMRISYFCSICLGFNQGTLIRTLRFSNVSTQWPQEKVAQHRNLHWLGFIIKETMFAPFQAQQKPRISTKMWGHFLWSWHRMRWPNSSRTLPQVKSWVIGILRWHPPGRILRHRHCRLGNLSSPIHLQQHAWPISARCWAAEDPQILFARASTVCFCLHACADVW